MKLILEIGSNSDYIQLRAPHETGIIFDSSKDMVEALTIGWLNQKLGVSVSLPPILLKITINGRTIDLTDNNKKLINSDDIKDTQDIILNVSLNNEHFMQRLTELSSLLTPSLQHSSSSSNIAVHEPNLPSNSLEAKLNFLRNIEISQSEYLKTDLDNQFNLQCDRNIARLYKIYMNVTMYIIVKVYNAGKSLFDNSVEYKAKFNYWAKNRINSRNITFSKEIIYGTYETFRNDITDSAKKTIESLLSDISPKSDQVSTSTSGDISVEKMMTGLNNAKITGLDSPSTADSHNTNLLLSAGGGGTQKKRRTKKGLYKMKGGDKAEYAHIKSLLELIAEPKHDFGKGSQSRSAAISHRINSLYDGDISGEKKIY